jgi:hypothetical protein
MQGTLILHFNFAQAFSFGGLVAASLQRGSENLWEASNHLIMGGVQLLLNAFISSRAKKVHEDARYANEKEKK